MHQYLADFRPLSKEKLRQYHLSTDQIITEEHLYIGVGALVRVVYASGVEYDPKEQYPDFEFDEPFLISKANYYSSVMRYVRLESHHMWMFLNIGGNFDVIARFFVRFDDPHVQEVAALI